MRLIVGNWKMNGARAAAAELAAAIAAAPRPGGVVRVVAPPFPLLDLVRAALAGSDVRLAAQDCHAEPAGARTGDVSAAMLAEAGCGHVIVGHSERRQAYGEGDALVAGKAAAAQAAGLVPIVCVGEDLAVREAGAPEAWVAAQAAASCRGLDLARIVIAYEPVWAIGTGRAATPEQAAAVHAAIRVALGAAPPILYGGSVKPDGAAALLSAPAIDGALVGGASLDAAAFIAICAAAAA